MDGNSCWVWPHRKSYYLKKPWEFGIQLWSNVKNTYMRARYGWCPMDVWNWDSWFINVAPAMFRYLANNGCGYPGDMTPDKWKQWLLDMAFMLEECSEEKYEVKNEYYGAYVRSFDMEENERKEIAAKYLGRDKELAFEADKRLKEFFVRLSERFWDMWD